MFIIGVDPHRGSHAAVVLDDHEQICDELALVANRHQRDRLLAWASRYEPRLWAIEGATGTGALLAQQLVAAGEAVVDASSGTHIRHRLNPDGNRQLNHALHVAALGQISHNTAGRDYYLRKQTEGHSRKEAMRSLKRRLSDAVYRQLIAGARR